MVSMGDSSDELMSVDERAPNGSQETLVSDAAGVGFRSTVALDPDVDLDPDAADLQ